ncbi:MAG: sulfatase-like hydrolase/transferase [Chloroflexota bacterium]
MKPNILFLMTDQMQGRVLDPDSPCITPNIDRLMVGGVRFPRAYTPNAVCSPARASLMTGLLPHSHGVLEVIHCVDDDQCCLRTEFPHWAQRLEEAGYRTGYFGKWHVERSNDLTQFGWQVDGNSASELFQSKQAQVGGKGKDEANFSLKKTNDLPGGYKKSLLYGVTGVPAEERGVGITTDLGLEFLQEAVHGDAPWCCFVSITEPHDPFVTGEDTFAQYDVDQIPLQPNVHNDLSNQPNIYRKAGKTWHDMDDRQKKEAAACYYASITEIDQQYGRLIDFLETSGQMENTIIIFSSDHGELLGSHGLYCKNISGFEEVYNIPLVMKGPGIPQGVVSQAIVGLHDLAPTLLDLCDIETIDVPDSTSFVEALQDPSGNMGKFSRGFAEYHGGRYRVTQRVVWNGWWKLCLNGFDFDELYNLEADPFEMSNLADDPAYEEQLHALTQYAWEVIRDTGDRALFNSHYPILRWAPVGPGILDQPNLAGAVIQ